MKNLLFLLLLCQTVLANDRTTLLVTRKTQSLNELLVKTEQNEQGLILQKTCERQLKLKQFPIYCLKLSHFKTKLLKKKQPHSAKSLELCQNWAPQAQSEYLLLELEALAFLPTLCHQLSRQRRAILSYRYK